MLWMAPQGSAMDVGARIASSVSPNKPKLTILLLPSEPAKGAPARVCHAHQRLRHSKWRARWAPAPFRDLQKPRRTCLENGR